MTLLEVQEILEAELLSGGNLESIDVSMVCGTDLMSDLLAHDKPCSLLLTGLTNVYVVRTAEIAGVEAVCFLRGKRPPRDTIALAHGKSLPLLVTSLPMFDSCGRLYAKGLKGCAEGRC
jgi:hypothetical protein